MSSGIIINVALKALTCGCWVLEVRVAETGGGMEQIGVKTEGCDMGGDDGGVESKRAVPSTNPENERGNRMPLWDNVDGRRRAVRKKSKDTDRYNLIRGKQGSEATGNPEPSSELAWARIGQSDTSVTTVKTTTLSTHMYSSGASQWQQGCVHHRIWVYVHFELRSEKRLEPMWGLLDQFGVCGLEKMNKTLTLTPYCTGVYGGNSGWSVTLKIV
ncbi:hypothetical protein B0H14DRAFT_2574462 [Mycena olivaceomarginata]|nr:hypothetical protein B0H14DRAFT_2574462 [Mycena olivaceomarginata]